MSFLNAGQPPAPSGNSDQATAIAQLLMGGGGANPATGLPPMGGGGGMIPPSGLGKGGSPPAPKYATQVPTPQEWVPQSSWWNPAQRQMTFTPQAGNTGGTGPLLDDSNTTRPWEGTVGGGGGTGGGGPHGGGVGPGGEGPITSRPTYPPEIIEAAGRLGVAPDKITPGLAHELGWNTLTPEQLAAQPTDTTTHGQQSNVPGQPGGTGGGATFGPLAPNPGQDTTSIQGFNLDPAKAPGIDPGFATNFNFLMNKYGPAQAYDFAMKQANQGGMTFGRDLQQAMIASGIPPADVSRVINQTNGSGNYFDFLQMPGGSNQYDRNTNTYTVGGKYTAGGLTGGQQIKLPAQMGG